MSTKQRLGTKETKESGETETGSVTMMNGGGVAGNPAFETAVRALADDLASGAMRGIGEKGTAGGSAPVPGRRAASTR